MYINRAQASLTFVQALSLHRSTSSLAQPCVHTGEVSDSSILLACTSLIILVEGFWELQGVSRSLNVMYLRPASLGATVLFKCKVVSLGKRTAALSCEVYDSSTKKLLATGTHDKVNIDAPVSRL